MASPARQVIDDEIRKLLDSYASLEEEKQRHARAALSHQHSQAIMEWLKKQDDEMANALAPKKPPSKPMKADEWRDLFSPHYHVFRLHQPEGLSTEEAVRQAPLLVFAEQIITDVVQVVAGSPPEFNPSPEASATQLADLAIARLLARLEEASLRKKWKTSASRGLPVIAQVSPDIASVIFYGCNENATKITRHVDSEKYFLTPSIPDISKKAQEKNSFIIGTQFCSINVLVDTHLQNWQARALFGLNDPEMVMPIIDNNFI